MSTTRRNFLGATGAAAAMLCAGPAMAIDPVVRTGKQRMRLSLAAYSMRDLLQSRDPAKKIDLPRFIDWSAGLDLDAVELTAYYFPPTPTNAYLVDLKRRCHLHGLDISGGAIGNNFTLPEGDKLDEQVKYTRSWIDHYATLGAPVIRVFAGNPPRGTTEEVGIARAVKNLQYACEYAAEKGVMLAIENHDYLTRVDRLIEVIKQIDSPWFGVNLDSANISDPEPYKALEKMAPYAVNMQMKVRMPNGKGGKEATDFKRVIEILKKTKYSGYVALEYEEREDPYEAIPRYLAQLRAAMAEAHQTMQEMNATIDPVAMIRPGRKITGMSAVLLPFTDGGSVDYRALERHVAVTADAGLWPAVNMDTGYGHLIDDVIVTKVLQITQRVCGDRPFAAGAFVASNPDDSFDLDAYRRQIELIITHGGTPVIFQSFGLTQQGGDAIIESYAAIGECCERFIAFELGKMFAPFGEIYDLDTYAGLMRIPQCIGAKHSSLSRELEWQRLQLRDAIRPKFMVLTGNDLGIDMVMYGSDYLLGLSTCCPDLFAKRDAFWQARDNAFYELNDTLQYLGHFLFRNPVPAYKHNAAMFLKLRQWIGCDSTHPQSPTRPDTDRAVLTEIWDRLRRWE